MQALEQRDGVAGIGLGVERAFKIFKGIGVVAQIDLHAAHIDVADAAGLQLLHMGDGGVLGGKVLPIRTVGHGPWPGKKCLFLRVPASRFDARDGRQKFIG